MVFHKENKFLCSGMRFAGFSRSFLGSVTEEKRARFKKHVCKLCISRVFLQD